VTRTAIVGARGTPTTTEIDDETATSTARPVPIVWLTVEDTKAKAHGKKGKAEARVAAAKLR